MDDLIRHCEECDGSGVIEFGHPNAPEPDRVEKCRACNGTGEVSIPTMTPTEGDMWQHWAESMEASGII